jgi:hypothetical protein
MSNNYFAVNNLKKIIGSKLYKVRNPRNSIPKIVRRRAAISSNNSIEITPKPELAELLKTGACSLKNCIPAESIESWHSMYGIHESNFSSALGNYGFPFYNAQLHSLLTDSLLLTTIKTYFQLIYNKAPVLQVIPNIVITSPLIEQNSFQRGVHNFPANWHVDYNSEFTVHIPLTTISSRTSHTKYLSGSHVSLLRPSLRKEEVDTSDVKCCSAVLGEALLIDVDGWHRAHLVPNTCRILIQLKFTTGNDALSFPEDSIPQKLIDNVMRTKTSCLNYHNIRSQLKSDLEFLESIGEFDPMISILKDNMKNYELYL